MAYIANIHPPLPVPPTPPALFASLCTDIIGMKLNLYHVEYLTSHRSERLSINRQRSSAVLIDNPRAECIESGCGEWRGLRGRLGCERVRVFGSDGPVSASTYNILCWSISATPFSLSVRLATFPGGGKAPSRKRGEKSPRPTDARDSQTFTSYCRQFIRWWLIVVEWKKGKRGRERGKAKNILACGTMYVCFKLLSRN